MSTTHPQQNDGEVALEDGFDHEDSADLSSQVSSSLKWAFAAQLVFRIGNLATNIALARILTQGEIGVFAVASTILLTLLNLNDMGLVWGLVRHQGPINRRAQSAVTLAMAFSGAVALVMVGFSGPLAGLYGGRAAAPLVQVLALTVLFDALVSVPNAILVRELREKERAVIDLGSLLVQIPVSIGFALSGAGAWSLVWGRIAGSSTATVLAMRAIGYIPRPGWDRNDARELVQFGVPLAMGGLMFFGILNLDYLIVGNLLGEEQLGIYWVAFNIAFWPVMFITTATRRVTISIFAKVQDDIERLRAGFATAIELMMLLAIPTSLGLAIFSREIVVTLYGERWEAGAVPLRFLALTGLVRIVAMLMRDVITAKGHSRAIRNTDGLWIIALFPALIVAVRTDGLRGAGIAQLVVVSFVALPIYAWILHRDGVAFHHYKTGLIRPLLGAAAMATVGLFLRAALDGLAPPLLAIVAGPPAGLVFFAVALTPARARELMSFFRNPAPVPKPEPTPSQPLPPATLAAVPPPCTDKANGSPVKPASDTPTFRLNIDNPPTQRLDQPGHDRSP